MTPIPIKTSIIGPYQRGLALFFFFRCGSSGYRVFRGFWRPFDFGIVVDRDMVDDAWPLMDAVREALDEFEEIVGGRRTADVT